MHPRLELLGLPRVPRGRHDRHVDSVGHEVDDQVDHAAVLLDVPPVLVESPVRVKGEEADRGRGRVDLRNVENVPQLGKVRRDVASPREGEELVVLLEGFHEL